MTQQVLHVRHRHATGAKQRAKRVPQRMRRDAAPIKLGAREHAVKKFVETRGRELPAEYVREHDELLHCLIAELLRAHLSCVCELREHVGVLDRHAPRLLPFAEAHEQFTALDIDVAPYKRQHLGAPQPRLEHESHQQRRHSIEWPA